MNDFLEILKYILPAGIVFATSYFLIKDFLGNQIKHRELEVKINGKAIITPIRLQAYERVALLLERISPGSLIMRVQKTEYSVTQLQSALIHSIRDEFEHNLSQQVYLSAYSWELVKEAKEEMIKLVNVAASQLNENATSNDLCTNIFALTLETKKLPTNKALDYLKKEIRATF
jgi:hypothetical protein